MPYPSLYAVVKLARVLQSLGGRLRYLVGGCLSFLDTCNYSLTAQLETYPPKTSQG